MMNSKTDLAFELATGVIGANMDASMPGSGVLTSRLAQYIYKSIKGTNELGSQIDNFINQLVSSLEKFSDSEKMVVDWVYVKEAVIPLAVSILSGLELDNGEWLKAHNENTASAVEKIFKELSSAGTLPDDQNVVSLLNLIFTSWIDAVKDNPIVFAEISRLFRQYVIENLTQISGDVKSMAALLSANSLLDPYASFLGTVPKSTTALLNARNAVVQFYGRSRQINSTIDWCNETATGKVACRLVYGPSGSGKTRLCIRIASILRNELKPTEQWVAGFLDESISSFIPENLQELCRNHRRILMVVDRAETKRDLIARLTKIATRSSQESGATIRIILIARNNGEWLQQLSAGNDELNQVLADSNRSDICLEPLLAKVEERVEYYKSACIVFNQLTAESGDNAFETLGIASDSVLKDALRDTRFTNPLVVQMAAIRNSKYSEKFDIKVLFDHALHSEENYWNNYLSGRGVPHLFTIIPMIFALLAIFDGTNCRSNTHYLVKRALEFVGRNTSEASIIVDLLYSFYQRDIYSDRGVFAIQPDLLSEYLFLECVYKNDGLLDIAKGFEFPQSVPQLCIEYQILTILNRSAHSFQGAGDSILYNYLSADLANLARFVMDIARESEGPIGNITADIVSIMDSSKLAMELIYDLPDKSNALKQLAIAVTERAYRQPLGQDLENSSSEEIEDYARGQANLCNRAHDVGDYILSLQSAVNSVNACTELFNLFPTPSGTVNTKYAVSIAHAWLALGKALEYIDRVHIDVRTEIFTAFPKIPLNLSMNPVALLLPSSSTQAVDAAAAAVHTFGHFSKINPAKFSILHAIALNGLSNRQAKVGAIVESLESIRKVIDIHRNVRLGEESWALTVQRDHYGNKRLEWEHSYASSLMNLSNRLANYWLEKKASFSLEKRNKLETEILTSIEDCLVIERANAIQDSDKYEYSLAISLVNYSARLHEQRKVEPALKAVDEAVSILRRQHAQNYSPENLRNLAEALRERAQCHEILGDDGSANEDRKEFDRIWVLMAYKPGSGKP